jgi:DNA-binding response OmpR family regulator
MLPGIDGFEVAKQLRADHNFVPVLMLTARSRPEDVLKGFEAGADDYLPKPFELEIFLARLNGLLRRNEWARSVPKAKDGRETINGRVFDLANLQLQTADGIQNLTLMEAKLLAYLIEHEGQAVSRKTILEDVWGLQEDTDTRAIETLSSGCERSSEDEPNDPKFLKTVRGIGYRLDRK